MDYGWQDVQEFIDDYKRHEKTNIYPDLVAHAEMFNIDKFEEDYKHIKQMGFYIVDLSQRYPTFKEWLLNKYNIKEKEEVRQVEDWSQYSQHDCEMFIGFMMVLREDYDNKGKDYDLSDFDFLEEFVEDYEEYGLDQPYLPLTEKYPKFKDYMRSVYGTPTKGDIIELSDNDINIMMKQTKGGIKTTGSLQPTAAGLELFAYMDMENIRYGRTTLDEIRSQTNTDFIEGHINRIERHMKKREELLFKKFK